MKGFQYDFELEGGVNDEHIFTIAFNSSPIVPAKTQGDPDDCHDAEGGEIEDLAVFFRVPWVNETHEVPEYLWPALGFDREELEEKCQEHASEPDEKCDERNK